MTILIFSLLLPHCLVPLHPLVRPPLRIPPNKLTVGLEPVHLPQMFALLLLGKLLVILHISEKGHLRHEAASPSPTQSSQGSLPSAIAFEHLMKNMPHCVYCLLSGRNQHAGGPYFLVLGIYTPMLVLSMCIIRLLSPYCMTDPSLTKMVQKKKKSPSLGNKTDSEGLSSQSSPL